MTITDHDSHRVLGEIGLSMKLNPDGIDTFLF